MKEASRKDAKARGKNLFFCLRVFAALREALCFQSRKTPWQLLQAPSIFLAAALTFLASLALAASASSLAPSFISPTHSSHFLGSLSPSLTFTVHFTAATSATAATIFAIFS